MGLKVKESHNQLYSKVIYTFHWLITIIEIMHSILACVGNNSFVIMTKHCVGAIYES